jgi:endonuclease/exonuclease/phosphatase family metal-dependent hydrolase
MPDTFKVLTYNALHGLLTGTFGVAPGETPEQNETRFRLLIAQLARVQPDVAFLQEVNPLPLRSEAYVGALKELGLAYDEVHQVDACGIRTDEKRALFADLNNGLVILAKKPLRLRKLAGLKLSGEKGECHTDRGFQLEELRYALIAEITIPGSSRRHLVATTHLHSGFEAGRSFLAYLASLHSQGRLSKYRSLRWNVEQARLRRIGEIDRLSRTLQRLKRDENYAGILFGGDLNFEPDDPEYEELQLLRYVDTTRVGGQNAGFYTADPPRNRLIPDAMTSPLPSVLTGMIGGEGDDLQAEITRAYRTEMQRPRQIDYLIEDSFLPGYCLTQSIFGLETDEAGLPASDHYGLLNSYALSSEACAGPGTL